jgi:hypothetical protein
VTAGVFCTGTLCQPMRTEPRLTWVMSNFVACTELSALREHHKRMTTLWAQSELTLEAGFALNVAVVLLDLHRFWCARCRARVN